MSKKDPKEALDPTDSHNLQPDPVDQDKAPEAGSGNEIQILQQELADTQQRLLRVSADYQNFARRSQNNIINAREEQLFDVAKSLLVVLDHFDRALSIDPGKTPTASLLQGVQIVRDELLTALERFDVRKQSVSEGEEFIPGKHEAVMQQPVENMEPGMVAAILQTGYELGEKTLRPAKVSVSQ